MRIEPCTVKERAFQEIWTQAEETERENINRKVEGLSGEMRLVVLSNAAALAIIGTLGVDMFDASWKHLVPAIEHDPTAVVEARPLDYRLCCVASHLVAFQKLYSAGRRNADLWRHIIFGMEVEYMGLGSPNIGTLVEMALQRCVYSARR